MHYLLVGNGPAADITAKALHADAVIQINTCRHAEVIPRNKTTHVVLVNSGDQSSYTAVDKLTEKQRFLPDAIILLARNPLFYTLKRMLIRLRSKWRSECYLICNDHMRLSAHKENFSFLATILLEGKLLFHGMNPAYMPSTGMIAYEWLKRKLRRGDSLELTGFTFKGWEGHPWAIEKKLIKELKM